MTEQLQAIVNRLAGFLQQWLLVHNGFDRRSFYGETFALLFLNANDRLTPDLRSLLIQTYGAKSKSAPEFHWEFNNYALLRYREATGDQTVNQYLSPLRFKYTLSTNWILLRLTASWLAGCDQKTIIEEAKSTLDTRQHSNGQIWDGKHDRSFQYHAFSLAMLGELCQLSNDPDLKNCFADGLRFIRHFILFNGDSLYIGRGQQQCFGYGALVYALALGVTILGDSSINHDLKRLIGHISRYQRTDGSFPLVFNTDEYGATSIPESPANLPGWYPYNNYFDYLPFFGYMLARAHMILRTYDNAPGDTVVAATDYSDNDYAKIIRPSYQAVLSRPRGYWTNDMAFPYVVYKNESLFPCCGSRAYLHTPRRDMNMPYPHIPWLRQSLRSLLMQAKLTPSQLTLYSPWGKMNRRYTFDDQTIIIDTRALSWPHAKDRLVLKNTVRQVSQYELADRLYTLRSSKPLIQAGGSDSAAGPLIMFDTWVNPANNSSNPWRVKRW